eukprot:284816234_2
MLHVHSRPTLRRNSADKESNEFHKNLMQAYPLYVLRNVRHTFHSFDACATFCILMHIGPTALGAGAWLRILMSIDAAACGASSCVETCLGPRLAIWNCASIFASSVSDLSPGSAAGSSILTARLSELVKTSILLRIINGEIYCCSRWTYRRKMSILSINILPVATSDSWIRAIAYGEKSSYRNLNIQIDPSHICTRLHVCRGTKKKLTLVIISSKSSTAVDPLFDCRFFCARLSSANCAADFCKSSEHLTWHPDTYSMRMRDRTQRSGGPQDYKENLRSTV